jgi:site-specific recombinase XerD
LAEYLTEHIKTAEPEQVWLFPSNRSRCGHIKWPEYAFREVVIAAGLDPKQVVRHTLRHTAITHLVQAGVDLPTVQRISGHKTLQMVARYSHQNGEHIQAAMDVLEKRYKVSG